MAGLARTNAILDALDKRRRDHFEDDAANTTALDYIVEWLADGKTLKALAQELTDQLHFEVWAESLHRLLRRQHGDGTVEAALAAARARASHGFAEDSLELVDKADGTMASAVSKASSQARSRQWLASKWNRKDYGDDKGVSVSVSIGSLHLDALRSQQAKVTGGLKTVAETSGDTLAQPSQPVAIASLSSD